MEELSIDKKLSLSGIARSSYSTITDYLEKLLYPTLRESINKVKNIK